MNPGNSTQPALARRAGGIAIDGAASRVPPPAH